VHKLGIVDPSSNFKAGLSNTPMELEVNLHTTERIFEEEKKNNKKKMNISIVIAEFTTS
jgi:hypothetical protein